MQRWFSLPAYGRLITEAADDSERCRAFIRQLPREFHSLSNAEQSAALAERPEPTGERPRDAFLAAVVEHIAGLHGHPVPEWVDEPEWFLDLPWVVATTHGRSASNLSSSLPRRSSGTASSPIRAIWTPAAAKSMSGFPDPQALDRQALFPHDPIPERNLELIVDCLQSVRDARASDDGHLTRSSRDSGPIR